MAYEIEVHKAQGYVVCNAHGIESQSVDDLNIVAKKDLPDFQNIDISYQFFKNDANQIFNGLIACLPGGTVDQLLLLLLEHKASQFRVSYGKFKEEKKDETTR